METKPHDNWSKFYDFVYTKSFGHAYEHFTDETLKVIKEILPDGSIIDYGAGTGRVAIPLNQSGYEIIAVERSSGMASELIKKRDNLKLNFPVYNCSISEYDSKSCDLALAIFTVLSYSITDDELFKNLENICKHLKPKGYLFLDLPDMVFFNLTQLPFIQTKECRRSVRLINTNQDSIYVYKEYCSGIFNGENFEYTDEFQLKYWELTYVGNLLKQLGLIQMPGNFNQFANGGSTYKLFQKQ